MFVLVMVKGFLRHKDLIKQFYEPFALRRMLCSASITSGTEPVAHWAVVSQAVPSRALCYARRPWDWTHTHTDIIKRLLE